MLHEDGWKIAKDFAGYIKPCVEKGEIAGSLRRRKALVKDVEVVIRLKRVQGLLEDHLDTDGLNASIERMVRDGFLKYNTEKPCNGDKQKRFTHIATGVSIEIYIATEDNYGYILWLRTGSAEYNQRVVLPVSKGGCQPSGIILKDGYVKRIMGPGQDDQVVPCPTEEDFFKALNMEWIEPKDRIK